MGTEKTSWEVELDEDVSPAARKAETALGRLHKQIQRFSASATTKALGGMNRVRDRVNGIADKVPGLAAVRNRKMGPLHPRSFDASAVKVRDRVAGSWDKGSNKLTSFGKKWDKFKSNEGVNKAFEKTAEVVTLVSAAALAVVAGITVAAIKMVDFGQKSRAAFSMMLGGEAKGAAAFQRSRDLAKELGMNIADVTLSYQRFLSMGFEQAEAEQLIKMGADMTALGASTEKVRSVLDAMGKIQATGTMQGDELMMLAEAGINIGSIYDKLGEKFGKTRAEIVKMKEAGKISSRDAIDAIKATVLATTKQTEFGAARKVVIGATIGGGWDKMKAEFKDKMIGIADASAPALARALSAINTRLAKVLNGPDGEKIMGSVVRMIEWISSAIEDNLPGIEEFIRAFADGMSSVLGPMWEIAGGISSAFGEDKTTTIRIMGEALGQLVGVAISAAAVLGGGVLQALQSICVVINDIVRAATAMTNLLGSGWFAAEDALLNAQAKQDAANRGVGGSGIAGVKDMSGQVASVAPGSASTSNSTTLHTTVNATAPEGGTKASGEAWGKGAAQGMQRGQMAMLEGANIAAGT